MKLNKTTINFARKRGLDITTTDLENDNDNLLLCIWEADNDCEWMCSYRIENDKLTWDGNVYLRQEVKEELPATIFDERQLRNVIKFIASSCPQCF